MTTSSDTIAVPIQPESDIYGTYRRLSYRPWYAIAEFVDNSTWNFTLNRDNMKEVLGHDPILEIDIFYDRDKGALTVSDNANGMDEEEFQRALQLAKPPTDRSGRSEFGMGLKTAACWLGPRWRLVSKKLGSDTEYSSYVDVDVFRTDKPKSLTVQRVTGLPRDSHYTRIDVEGLREYNRVFVGRTLGKIKKELSSMYRRDLESGSTRIRFNAEELSWWEPELWTEYVDGVPQVWRKEVDFTVEGKRVTGWIGLLAKGEAAEAGLHLFRRDRLITGGPGQGWKPWEIFKAPNSFQSQRLYGELNFDDWMVSHTKDHIEWSGAEEQELIRLLLDASADYVAKARESRKGKTTFTKKGAETTLESEREIIEENDDLGATVQITEQGFLPSVDADETDRVTTLLDEIGETLSLRFGGTAFPTLHLGVTDEADAGEPLVRLGFPKDDEVTMILNLRHPFIVNYVGGSEDRLRLLSNLLYVDALVERIARRMPQVQPAQLRLIKDQFLRTLRVGDDD